MKVWVEAQAQDGRYSNSSDYARDLIRRDQVQAEKIAATNVMIQEGLGSGISDRTFDEIVADALARAGAAKTA